MPTVLKPTSEETRLYEVAVLLAGNSSDKERQETMKGIDELFAERKIVVREKDEWKKMGLAYKIKGQEQGQYVIFYVEAQPNVMQDLEKVLRIERGVLRHLVLSLADGYEIQDWAAHFTEWKAEAVNVEERKAKDHEEELKKRIVQRAARKTKQEAETAAELKSAEASKPAEEVSPEELSQKLGQMISDEDLHL